MTSERRLDSVCEIVDCPHKTARRSADAYAYAVGTKAIRDGRIDFSQARPVDEETYTAWIARAVPREGDIILCREAPVGPVGRLPAAPRVCLGQRTVLLRPDPSQVDPDYLLYALLAPHVQAGLRTLSEGSTVAHLNVADVRRFTVPLPSLSRQRVVARVLRTLDDKIESTRRLAQLHRAVAQALFDRDFGVPGGWRAAHHHGRPAPDGCNWGVLRDLVTLLYGKALKADARDESGPVVVVGSSGIVGRHSVPVRSGPGIVVGRKGTAGSVTWIDGDFWPIDTTFFALPNDSIPLLFAYFALTAADLAAHTSDSAVPGLNRDIALSIPCVVPPRYQAERFAAAASPLFAAASGAEREATLLANVRGVLLRALVTGRQEGAVGREPAAAAV